MKTSFKKVAYKEIAFLRVFLSFLGKVDVICKTHSLLNKQPLRVGKFM